MIVVLIEFVLERCGSGGSSFLPFFRLLGYILPYVVAYGSFPLYLCQKIIKDSVNFNKTMCQRNLKNTSEYLFTFLFGEGAMCNLTRLLRYKQER